MSVSRGPARRAWQGALSLTLLLYACVLAGAPLLHHDLSCELKSRTHCKICVSGVSGPGLANASELPTPELSRVDPVPVTRERRHCDPRSRAVKGRSPPSA